MRSFLSCEQHQIRSKEYLERTTYEDGMEAKS